MKTLIILLSPFAPHVCEEAWELLAQQRGMPAKGSSIAGNKGFVSLEKWPRHDETLIDRKLEMMEELVEGAKEDIKEVIKIVGKQPKSIIIYIAPLWKYSVYNEIIERAKKESEIKNILKSIMQIPEARSQGKHAAMFAERLAKDARMLKGVLSQEEELKAFGDSKAELESAFGCSIRIMKAEGSSSLKALRAEPGKPGIEVE